MDDDDLTEALYVRMRWNAPLSAAHADLLMDRLDLRPGQRITDLGCGRGELLLRVVARALNADAAGTGSSRTYGVGVDTDAAALGHARLLARQRLGELAGPTGPASPGGPAGSTGPAGPAGPASPAGSARPTVEFIEADAAAWHEMADRVLCVGASHAFGGTQDALRALGNVVAAGGRLLLGDGYWASVPSAAVVQMFGEQVLGLPELLEACRTAGWRVIHMSTADQREWDDFESTFRAGRQEWLLAHGDDPRAAEVRDWLDLRERQYVQEYRGVLGFAYLILAH